MNTINYIKHNIIKDYEIKERICWQFFTIFVVCDDKIIKLKNNKLHLHYNTNSKNLEKKI